MPKPRRRTRPNRGSAAQPKPPSGAGPYTLSIDIGGTGVKMLVLDAKGEPVNERARELTPQPAEPAAVLDLIARMFPAQPAFQRVSVGFPGVVARGVVSTAPNLGTELWRGFQIEEELKRLIARPVRVINDADLLGYGAIRGDGVELVLTLGTGLGSALFVDGRLVPNLELGHHPFKKSKTYEDRVSDRQLKRIGKRRWSKRVAQVIQQLEPLFNYDVLHLGGGNVENLKLDLPKNVAVFDPVQGMQGGIRLWADAPPEPASRAKKSRARSRRASSPDGAADGSRSAAS
jgi:polyphosphate glucokinase